MSVTYLAYQKSQLPWCPSRNRMWLVVQDGKPRTAMFVSMLGHVLLVCLQSRLATCFLPFLSSSDSAMRSMSSYNRESEIAGSFPWTARYVPVPCSFPCPYHLSHVQPLPLACRSLALDKRPAPLSHPGHTLGSCRRGLVIRFFSVFII